MFGCKGTSIPCKRPGNECGFVHIVTAFLFDSSALLHNLNTDSKVQIEVFLKFDKYANIVLDALRKASFPKLCWHNLSDTNCY